MTMQIVTGMTGIAHITSDDDRILNYLNMGNGKFVAEYGEKFRAEKINNNIVRVNSGVGMNQGTEFRIELNNYEDVIIDNGSTGTYRNDIIAARYTKNEDTSIENVSLVVIKGVTGNSGIDPEITSGNIIDGGDLIDDMPLYRIRIESLSIAAIEPLFKTRNPVYDQMLNAHYIKSDIDFNTLTVPGIYFIEANKCANTPDANYSSGVLIVDSSSQQGQIFMMNAQRGRNIYVRYCYHGYEWTAWEEISSGYAATADYAENAKAADQASCDANGNNIADTYATKDAHGRNYVNLQGGSHSGTPGYMSISGVHYGNVSKDYSINIGTLITSKGEHSLILGSNLTEDGGHSILIGSNNDVSGSHGAVFGSNNTGKGYGLVTGDGNTASGLFQTVIGCFNKPGIGASYPYPGMDYFIIGNGDSKGNTSNAFRVNSSGQAYALSAFNSSGADYAEFIKPWADGNEEEEDRVGYFVTVKDGLLYKAEDGDYIYGITSGNPSVVGNADEDYYWRYERDEFNRIVMEDAPEIIQQTDDDGNPVFSEETGDPVWIETGNIIPHGRMKLSDDYDPSQQKDYMERKNRKEWDYVGMVGVLPIRDDGTCIAGKLCKCGSGGIATLAEERGFDTYMVIERISDHIVSVLLK